MKGVPSTGTVALDTKRKAVQHLSGGIVKQVLVREGDEVQADQVLMRLDDAVAKANYADVRQGYFALLATQGRLIAEQQGHPKVEFARSCRRPPSKMPSCSCSCKTKRSCSAPAAPSCRQIFSRSKRGWLASGHCSSPTRALSKIAKRSWPCCSRS